MSNIPRAKIPERWFRSRPGLVDELRDYGVDVVGSEADDTDVEYLIRSIVEAERLLKSCKRIKRLW